MIFSYGSRPRGRHARTAPRRSHRPGPAAGRPARPHPAPFAPRPPETGPRGDGLPAGPYDISHAPSGWTGWDLGSLRIPVLAGARLRVQAGPDGVVRRAVVLRDHSALHLMVLAAPRTEPVWDEVRGELRTTLATRQATCTEVAGGFGVELWARVPVSDGVEELRMMGVNGPRWLLRADIHGPAATNPEDAAAFDACLRRVVVDRGSEPRPVREPLPLRLSAEPGAAGA